MICEICGKEYVLLANHIWQSHKIKVRDYKIKYNHPLTKALADESWVQKMKDIGNDFKESKGWQDKCKKLKEASTKENAKRKEEGSPVSKRKFWPKCSKEKVDKQGGENKKRISESRFFKALSEWNSGVPIKEMCVSESAIYRWKKEGRLPYRVKKRSV